jgi:hypothetical protein
VIAPRLLTAGYPYIVHVNLLPPYLPQVSNTKLLNDITTDVHRNILPPSLPTPGTVSKPKLLHDIT